MLFEIGQMWPKILRFGLKKKKEKKGQLGQNDKYLLNQN